MSNRSSRQAASEDLPLSKAAQLILDESRMLLPGIQALFGFQLIAVFNQTFSEKLTPFEQQLHLLAIALVVVTTIIIMTPAAYHRQNEVQHVTDVFIHLATRLMLLSMVPLAISICIDVYLVGRLILKDSTISLAITLGLFALFMLLWIGLPRIRALQRLFGGDH